MTIVAPGSLLSKLDEIDTNTTEANTTEAKQDALLDFFKPARTSLNEIVIESRTSQLDGIFHTAINTDIITPTVANGGSANIVTGHLVLATGTNVDTGSAKIQSVDSLIYKSGQEIFVQFSVAFTATAGAATLQRIGLANASNGFALQNLAGTMQMLARTGGADATTALSAANIDTLVGGVGSKFTRAGAPEAINWGLKNLVRFRFPWHGIGSVTWEALSPDGDWVAFHKMRYPNSQLLSHIYTPELPILAEVSKSAGASAVDIKMYIGCLMAGTTGKQYALSETIQDHTLAEVVRSVIAGVTTGGGGGYVNVKVTPSGALVVESTVSGTVLVSDTYNVNNVEDASATVAYVGKETAGGAWYLQKIDTTSGTAVRHATVLNNVGVASYNAAWTARESLSYADYTGAF